MSEAPSVHCNACLGTIPASHPRAHCLECPDHDLCMRCHSFDTPSQDASHHPSHRNTVTSFPSSTMPQQSIPQQLVPQPPTAATYWGQLLTAPGSPSPIFKRFLSALFTYVDRASEPMHVHGLDPVKISSVEEAMGVPDSENIILELLQIIFSAGGTVPDSDALVATMYRARQIDHVMITRQTDLPVWDEMPVVTHQGFMELHVRKLGLDPRQYWEGMNKVLGETPLVDPLTGAGFQWKTVPWECFPQEPVQAVVHWVQELEIVVERTLKAWLQSYAEMRKQRNIVDLRAISAQALQAQIMINGTTSMGFESTAAALGRY